MQKDITKVRGSKLIKAVNLVALLLVAISAFASIAGFKMTAEFVFFFYYSIDVIGIIALVADLVYLLKSKGNKKALAANIITLLLILTAFVFRFGFDNRITHLFALWDNFAIVFYSYMLFGTPVTKN